MRNRWLRSPLPLRVAAGGLSGRPESLIGHCGVPAHHLCRLPPTKLHDDLTREAGVQRHGGAVVSEIVEMEISEAAGPTGFPEHPGYVNSAVRCSVRIREHPLGLLALELPSKDLLGLRIEDHRAGAASGYPRAYSQMVPRIGWP